MKKWLMTSVILTLVSTGLAGCGKSNTQSTKQSNNTNDPNSVVGSNKTVTESGFGKLSDADKADNESTKKANEAAAKTDKSTSNFVGLNEEQIGIMLWMKYNPSMLKTQSKIQGLTYKRHQANQNKAIDGYSYITADGDSTSYVYYKVLGNAITYKIWKPTKSVTQGHFTSTLISAQDLKRQYYTSQNQKDIVNNYVSDLANNNN